MAFELEGKLVRVWDPVVINDKMSKREFVIDCGGMYNGQHFENLVKFQLINNRMEMLNGIAAGERVMVYFGVKGSRSEKDGREMWFVNLNAFEIRRTAPVTPAQQMESFNAQTGSPGPVPGNVSFDPNMIDDLPF